MNKGRANDPFIEELCAEALSSAAIRHPYLLAMQQGDFPDIGAALRDFAFQYGLYSARFTNYLTAVINSLEDPAHRKILQDNLDEERGHVHDVELPQDVVDRIEGQPHAQLFELFQAALGVSPTEPVSPGDEQPGMAWSRGFQELCETNAAVGVGAIGIGTELIVSGIYRQILDGLKTHTNLSISERVFFELHSECDDEHAAQLNIIAAELAQDEQAAEQIAYGAQMAIALRTTFWDQMLERARSTPAATSHSAEALTDVGYQTSL